MRAIICPHCSKAVKIDEAGHAAILKPVGDGDLTNSCTSGWSSPRGTRDTIALAEAKVAKELQKAAAAKDTEITL